MAIRSCFASTFVVQASERSMKGDAERSVWVAGGVNPMRLYNWLLNGVGDRDQVRCYRDVQIGEKLSAV